MGIVVYEDNDGAVQLARNPVTPSRTKHVDDRHHFIRDTCSRVGKVQIKHANSSNQRVDFLTKPFREEVFTEHKIILLKYE